MAGISLNFSSEDKPVKRKRMLWKGQRIPKGKVGVPRADLGKAVPGSPGCTKPSAQELSLCTT